MTAKRFVSIACAVFLIAAQTSYAAESSKKKPKEKKAAVATPKKAVKSAAAAKAEPAPAKDAEASKPATPEPKQEAEAPKAAVIDTMGLSETQIAEVLAEYPDCKTATAASNNKLLEEYKKTAVAAGSTPDMAAYTTESLLEGFKNTDERLKCKKVATELRALR